MLLLRKHILSDVLFAKTMSGILSPSKSPATASVSLVPVAKV